MFRPETLIQCVLTCVASYLLGGTVHTAWCAEPRDPSHWTTLATDQAPRAGSRSNPAVSTVLLPNEQLTERTSDRPSERTQAAPQNLQGLLRPRLKFFAEWEPESNGLAISSFDLAAKTPLYPVFGPPPPFIHTGYSLTQIAAPVALDLPENLHDFSLGLAWMRRINDRWMARFTLNGAFASDMENSSSDAWQLRAGGFAMYRPNERWSWAFGAVATGRNDIPVIPAVGVIWKPSPELLVNLMMPNPRISYLLAETETRQHWAYVGGGLSGGTWAYNRASGVGEQLSYREFRLVLGWETMPPRPSGTFRTTGTRLNTEIGYAFGRRFEFESDSVNIEPGDALLLRTGISF